MGRSDLPLICGVLEALALEDVAQVSATARRVSTCLRLVERARTNQFAQTISVRVMNIDLSSWRFTAPGMVSKKAGHPHPESLRCVRTSPLYHVATTHNFCFEV